MAELRPFHGLRFDAAAVEPALTISPPYDVISPEEQVALYGRSPYNAVRLEYGEQRPSDGVAENRYTRAAADLAAWRSRGMLVRDERPTLYAYDAEFEWEGRRYRRRACFGLVRLEEWEKGVVRPHEHTLPTPKADRLELLRAARTQISPVWSVFRQPSGSVALPCAEGDALLDFEADGQHHTLRRIDGRGAIEAFAGAVAAADVYIADGHHRYETALAYRDETRAQSLGRAADALEDFVLMALTDAGDPGLLVLPTHRIVRRRPGEGDAMAVLRRYFSLEDLGPAADAAVLSRGLERLRSVAPETAFLAVGLEPGRAHLLTLTDRSGVEALMPPDRPAAWRRLDVNVLQYGVLRAALGIDDAVLAAGDAVAYTQDAGAAAAAAAADDGRISFLLNATPVEQILEVADAGGRMPQKSTYFYPKLPTGLVLYGFDAQA